MENADSLDSSQRVAVDTFCGYIRTNTAQPHPDYNAALDFLKATAHRLGLPALEVHTPVWVNAPPIGIITIPGRDPSLPSVLLNSHMDVVPVVEDQWTQAPFGGAVVNGRVYGRGAQDMKCVTIQHLEAMSRIVKRGELVRTVHITMVPEEELGGQRGMKPFVTSDRFRALNVGVVLDEGLASPTNECAVYYTERIPRWAVVEAHGPTGHGSQIYENTAVEKLLRVVNQAVAFQKSQAVRVESDAALSAADVCTINTNFLEAGPIGHADPELNVVPPAARAGFDMRIPPRQFLEMMHRFEGWVEEAGATVRLKPPTDEIKLAPQCVESSTSSDDMWWKAVHTGLTEGGCAYHAAVFPASTDARYIMSAPSRRFSPMRNTPLLLHDNDEYLDVKVFLDGIAIFEHLIRHLANAVE